LAVPAQLRTLWQLRSHKNKQPCGEGTMDDQLCHRFFLQPQETFHRRYEALRAYFLDGLPLAEIADRFGYRQSSLKSLVCRFRAACAQGGPPPFFFQTDVGDLSVGDAVKIKMAPNHPLWPMPDS
jgi:hypothetical protein